MVDALGIHRDKDVIRLKVSVDNVKVMYMRQPVQGLSKEAPDFAGLCVQASRYQISQGLYASTSLFDACGKPAYMMTGTYILVTVLHGNVEYGAVPRYKPGLTLACVFTVEVLRTRSLLFVV